MVGKDFRLGDAEDVASAPANPLAVRKGNGEDGPAAGLGLLPKPPVQKYS